MRKDSLLEQQGAGSATFYTLADGPAQAWRALTGEATPEKVEQLSLGGNDPSLGKKQQWVPSQRDQAVVRELLGLRATEEKWKKALSILLREGGLTREQLSQLTERKERQLRDLLSRLVAEGFLVQTRPEAPNDPNQAYRLAKRDRP